MTLHPCQVTGTLLAPDGSLLPEVQVQFLPAPVAVRGTGQQTFAPHPVSVTTDVGAGLDVALVPGIYTVRARAPEGREYPPFLIDVPGQQTAAIADIQLHLPAPQSVYDAAASARVAARAAGDATAAAEIVAAVDHTAETSAAAAQASAVAAEASAAAAAASVTQAQSDLQDITDGAAQSLASAAAAETSAQTAGSAATAAETSAQTAGSAATAAETSAQTAGSAATAAETSAQTAGSAATAAQTAAETAEAAGRAFASRAAFQATDLPAGVDSWSVLHAGRLLHYVRDPAGTAIESANGVKGSPAGVITPDHWAENAVPGTTDMAPATQAALNFAHARRGSPISIDTQPHARVEFLNADYFWASRVSVPNAFQNVSLVGNNSRIITAHNGSALRLGEDRLFETDDALDAPASYSTVIEGLQFRNTNDQAVDSVAIEAGRHWEMKIRNCLFADYALHLDLVAVGHSAITGCTFRQRMTGLPGKAFLRIRSIFDSIAGPRISTGITIAHNEWSGVDSHRDLMEFGWLIHGVDAIYFSNNHMRCNKYHLGLVPTGSVGNYANNQLFDIMSGGNNYFDGPGSGANVLIQGTLCHDPQGVNPGRTTGLLRNIRFAASDKFRGGNNAEHAVVIDLTDGSITPGSYVAARGEPTVELSGEFISHRKTQILCRGPADGGIPVSLTLDNFKSVRAMADPTEDISILDMEGGRCTIGTMTVEPEQNPPQRLMRLDFAESGSSSTAGPQTGLAVGLINALASTYTEEDPISIANHMGAHVHLGTIIEKSSAGWRRDITGSATVVGDIAVVARTFDVAPSPLIYECEFRGVVDTISGGAADRFSSVTETLTLRRGSSMTEIPGGGRVLEKFVRSSGWNPQDLPASFALMTGPGWISGFGYTRGAVRTHGGNAYLCVTSGTSGSTAPNDTSGAIITDGTARWAYLGPENANRVAMVFSGRSGFALRCRGTVSITAGV